MSDHATVQTATCWACAQDFSAELMHEDGTCPECRQRYEWSNPEPHHFDIELRAPGLEGTSISVTVAGAEVTGTHAACGYKLTGLTVGGVLDGIMDECGCERSLNDRFIGG